MNSLKLDDNSRIAVIGGGPAGSLFALHLFRFASARDVHPQLTIYQERDFCLAGPLGCKGCAGILSMSVVRELGGLGLTIPEAVAQSRIKEYAVHSPFTTISISSPEKDSQITSVNRGNGPRISHLESCVSFDAWLLGEATKSGANIRQERVTRIDLTDGAVVETEDGRTAYDLIVLAAGVNSKALRITGHSYVPPETRVMAQDELYADAAEVRAAMGEAAHAFILPNSGMVFGTLVPKGQYINVSVLGNGKEPVSVTDFLNNETVKKVLPKGYKRVCGCRPKAAVAPARHYLADRFVAVGDAAVTRLYKDGIYSSLLTGREAARTVVEHGFSRRDFERHYKPHCDAIMRDNLWGNLIFNVTDNVKNSRNLLLTELHIVADEQNSLTDPRRLTRSAWGMFTGSYKYREIARMAFSPASVLRFGIHAVIETARQMFHKPVHATRQLYVGRRKVLILGSGFGGTYVLRKLVPALNRNENVDTTMVSSDNFMLFTPMLHEVATGSVETRHIAYPIRRLQWRDRFNFVNAEVRKIDLANRQVITSLGNLDYDYLVLALGSVSNLSGLEEMGKNVFTLKTLKDSMLIRNHIIECFERASVETDPAKARELLTFVVAGAGYTGIQMVTELRDYVFTQLTRYYKAVDKSLIRIVLVEAAAKIIGDLHTNLGAYTMAHLRSAGIEVRLKSRVTGLAENVIEVSSAGKTEQIPYSTLIWTAGVKASPRIAELPLEKDSIGRVYVNEYLEVLGAPGVYAVGDCAHFEDGKTGLPLPPRAHVAVRQAKVAAFNILARIRGRERRLCHIDNDAEIVSLGHSNAVFRYHRFRMYGLPARFLWTAGYTSLVTGNYNRTRVMLDWVLTRLFGRDTVLVKLIKE